MAQPSWIGQKLGGRYEILEELGAGGMSAVYKANDPNLNRIVAIKLIHPHLSKDQDFVRRFRDEAAVVAQLRHPNIVQVYDFNNDDDTYYIVFEFVPGETLQERLTRLNESGRKMSVEEVTKIAAQTADALNYAHTRDLVHRDIKPANIMLNIHGDAILTDFGIAKIMGGTQHTATGAVVGTARYMSPEQIKGMTTDGRTDLYSLGITMYEMASGNPPYEANSAMTLMMMHVNDPVPDATSAGIPVKLAQVIQTAMAKEPKDRFPKASEMAWAVRNYEQFTPLGGTSIESSPLDSGATLVETGSIPPASQPLDAQTIIETGGRTPSMGAGMVNPGGAGAPPTSPPVRTTAPAGSSKGGGGLLSSPLALVGGAAALLVIVFGILWATGVLGGGEDPPTEEIAQITETSDPGTVGEVVTEPTDTPVPDNEIVDPPTPTATNTPGSDDPPTPTPTNTPLPDPPTPTPTNTPGPQPTDTPPPPTNTPPPPPTATTVPVLAKSVSINAIRVEGDRYIVDYTTAGYTEALPGEHIHFYWNNISEDRAGIGPNQANWYVWGGPRPFNGFGTGDRPGDATAMCAVAANPDHTIMPGTGNCVGLP